jgi:hypothetical protein
MLSNTVKLAAILLVPAFFAFGFSCSNSNGSSSSGDSARDNCAALTTCCDMVVPLGQLSCDAILAAGIDAECAEELQRLQDDGQCSG